MKYLTFIWSVYVFNKIMLCSIVVFNLIHITLMFISQPITFWLNLQKAFVLNIWLSNVASKHILLLYVNLEAHSKYH